MNSTTLELPPQEFMNAVAGENISSETHVEIGNIFKRLLVDKCSIRPSDSILDIGSGCGRIASRFAGYTIAPYHGFDVVLPMVEWCQENITPRFPNFKFHHAAVKNTLYSDAGIDASNYVFPFADGTFDVVFATSVFTHLLPASARQYAKEIRRVLSNRGRAFLTFYLMNDERRRRIEAGDLTSAWFPHQCDGYKVASLENPEAVVAFEQSDATMILQDAGLKVETVSLGAWAKDDGWTYQDAILVK
jgi:SAM-dependent methyltransferase